MPSREAVSEVCLPRVAAARGLSPAYSLKTRLGESCASAGLGEKGCP